MRKLLALTVLAIFAATAFTPAIAQQGQQGQQEQAKIVRGTLQTVDVEAQTFSVKESEEAEAITVEVTSETMLQGPDGEITLADLAQHEGDNLEVRYVEQEQGMIALQVRLVA